MFTNDKTYLVCNMMKRTYYRTSKYTWQLSIIIITCSSPELKAHVSFSDRLGFVDCLSVCLSVNFSHSHLLLQSRATAWANFHEVRMKMIQVCSNEGLRLLPRGDNYEIAKIHWRNLKIFFSRTTVQISTKLAWPNLKATLGEGDSSLFK